MGDPDTAGSVAARWRGTLGRPSLPRPDRVLLGVLALAALVRVAVLLRTPGYAPFGDPADYDRIAASLAYLGDYPPTEWAATGSPTAFRGPAYPYLLSWVYELTGLRYAGARGLGVVLGTASVALVWGIAVRVADRRTAAVAALICAVLPSLAWLSGGLVAENLFVPVVLAAVLAALAHRDRARWTTAALVGVLCGLAALTRSNGLVVALPLLLGLWTVRRRAADPLVAIVAIALTLTPWAIRNTDAFGRFTPLGTASGYTLSGAWNPESARGGEAFAASRNPPEVPAWGDLFAPGTRDEAQLERALRSRALRFGVDHPWFVVRATVVHGLRQLHLGPGQATAGGLSAQELGVPASDRWTLRPPLLVLVALAGVAAIGAARRRRLIGPWWLWAVPVVIFMVAVPIVGGPRYRIPADPFLALAAAPVILAAVDLIRGRRDATPGPHPARMAP